MEENYGHKPVLLHECLGALAIKPDGIYVDGTLGRAGHSLEIVKRLTTGRLIGVDRDQVALAAAGKRLEPWKDRVTLVHSNFSALDDVLRELGVKYALIALGIDVLKGFLAALFVFGNTCSLFQILSSLFGGVFGKFRHHALADDGVRICPKAGTHKKIAHVRGTDLLIVYKVGTCVVARQNTLD